ncbi:hypothetical protein TASIC1_0002013300 [Trichoderma asperellum]|uniref:Zn(2)-C6 fungal-type domain-containing protein n=1 Tax=Trichoderma asperellum TaxID=101201 RepID=A0A6V8QL55_TRIAP|nr:hypothetical protein TASIC1_0002013300 [Trichoderma asperellum]
MAQYRSVAPLPQGFSVYQPQLGAQLQFFPALGSQELDDMINAYIPGPAALKEKRASISLDFLEHTQLTGQTFKFYPVYSSSPVAASPAISTSSFSNTSPVNSTWDWSQASASPAVSSRSSSSKSRKASQYSTPDLSHLPGMKIMTKDGQDVTDSASRGSKTKEQRDHAHLMRIIKACDSCRRKKIRCDPSHKKRTAAQTQPQSKQAKKARTAAAAVAAAVAAVPPQKSASVVALSRGQDDNPDIPMSMFGIDPTFTFAGLDSFESNDQTYESWEEFIQYPVDVADEHYDFFLDPEGYLSSQSSASSSSASPPKASTPASQQDLQASFGLEEREGMLSESTSPELPFLQVNHTGLNNYTDFSLFSPSSSFSEDDRMLSISSSRTLSPTQPSASESESFGDGFDVDGHGLASGGSGSSALVSPLEETGLVAAADTSLPWYDPGPSPGDSRAQDSRAGISITRPAGWVGDVRITYSPGGSVLVTASSVSGAEIIANNAFANSGPFAQLDTSRPGSIAIAIAGRDTSGEITTSQATSTALQFGGAIQDELQSYGHSPTERGRLRSETPVGDSARLFGEQAVFRTETTSSQTASPSTLATAANHSVQYSTGSVESSSMARAEYLANNGINPEVSPGNLQLSFGATSDALLLGSAAFAAAGEDATTASPQASSATALEWPHLPAVGTNGSRSSQAALQNGEAQSQQQAAAPMAEDGIQPTSLLLLQTSLPKREAASDDGVEFGIRRSFNRWIGVQALAQATSVILIGILAAMMLAALTGSRQRLKACWDDAIDNVKFKIPTFSTTTRDSRITYNFFSSSSLPSRAKAFSLRRAECNICLHPFDGIEMDITSCSEFFERDACF